MSQELDGRAYTAEEARRADYQSRHAEALAERARQDEENRIRAEERQAEAEKVVQALRERDPDGVDQHELGAKLDSGKIPVMRGAIRQFPRALEAVAELSAIGAAKYTWEGWRCVRDGEQRYSDARGRHELAYAKGELRDPDTHVLHLTAVAWNALAELELFLSSESVP